MHFANSPSGAQFNFSVEIIFDPVVGSAVGLDTITVAVGWGDGVAEIWTGDGAVGDSEFML